MKKVYGVLFVLAVYTAVNAQFFGAPKNTRGDQDTAKITTALSATVVRYTRALPLTDGEDIRVLCKANDTTNAGFTGDSLQFQWGYQTGTLTRNSTGARDTAWDGRIILDTLDTDSLGKQALTVGDFVPTGTLTRRWDSHSDTLNVSGYAVQSRWFVPEWDELIRYWALALGKQKLSTHSDIIFEQHRRAGIETR